LSQLPEVVTIETRGKAVHLRIPSVGVTFIRRNDGTKLVVDGDLYVAATGEIGIMTDGNNISFDSINGKIFFNSRQSKPLKNLASSRRYLESIAQVQPQQNQREHWPLYDLIGDLRKRVDNLENILREKTTEGE
jgi:hypothetical protein